MYRVDKGSHCYRVQQGQCLDRRVHAMNEIITGITTIKVNCWEKAFSTLINNIRGSVAILY